MKIVTNYFRTPKKLFAVNLKPLFQNSKKKKGKEINEKKHIHLCGVVAAINIF